MFKCYFFVGFTWEWVPASSWVSATGDRDSVDLIVAGVEVGDGNSWKEECRALLGQNQFSEDDA